MALDDPAPLESRVVRYADLRPCLNAFIDTRSPGSEAKENFTIIGPGVSENPEQHVHIAERHGFNIGGARQPPGCVNSQHSHDSAEVFVVHSGRWRFTLGERGRDAAVECGPGDTISLPTRMFRGFTNIGDDVGFLWAVLGGDDPGRVTWAPHVFDMAKDFGLVLLDNGSLVDTARGERIPYGRVPMPRTSAAQVAALHVPTNEEAEALVVRDTAAWASHGVAETPVIGPQAPLDWPHGFTLDRVDLLGGATVTENAENPVVAFVHQGRATVESGGETVELGAGDTISLPRGREATLAAAGVARLFVVRGQA